jgi:predicted 3-demethylubiquinone-9 3-methyltransferase (glyoxalase superfamily)
MNDYAAIARHQHGIAKTQVELIREMLDWFE